MINGYKPPLPHDQIIARIQCFYDMLNFMPTQDLHISDLTEIFYNMFEEFIYDLPIQDEGEFNEQ